MVGFDPRSPHGSAGPITTAKRSSSRRTPGPPSGSSRRPSPNFCHFFWRARSRLYEHEILQKKNTPALRARGLHTRSRWSSVISKRKQTNTLELMAFFWHGNSASVRLQNPPKASKNLQKPSKHLERDPTPDVTLVCDSHDDRFLQTAQISLKRCRFPQISLKRLKSLMISLKAWWFP